MMGGMMKQTVNRFSRADMAGPGGAAYGGRCRVSALLLALLLLLSPGATADTVAKLEKLEKTLERYRPDHRHHRPQNIVAAMVLVHQLGDQKERTAWIERLFGTDTRATKTVAIIEECRNARFERLLDLPGILYSSRWYELADQLQKEAKQTEDKSWDNATAALYFLEICMRSGYSSGGRRALGILQESPDKVQESLLSLVVNATEGDRHKDIRQRFCYSLRYAARYGSLTQPRWCNAALDMMSQPNECRELVEGLRRAKKHELAAEAALRTLVAHPTDTYTIRTCFEALIHAKRGKEAFNAILDAETNVPYPAKRQVRLQYFQWLRSASYRVRHGTPLPPEIMTLREEREDRLYAAADLNDLEAQMALADFHSMEGKRQEAADIYRDAFIRATDPALLWTAWIAWAEYDATAAWFRKDRAAEVMAASSGETVGPVSPRSFTRHVLAVGLAAGEAEEALDWAEERVDGTARDAADMGMVTALVLARCATGAQDRALELLRDYDNDLAAYNAIQGLLRLKHGSTASGLGVSAGLARAVATAHKQRFRGGNAWAHAARLAVALTPSFKTSDRIHNVWQQLLSEFPAVASPESVSLQRELTDVSLAWLDAHPEDQSALQGMLATSASFLYHSRPPHTHEHVLRMFAPCLERAKKRDITLAYVKSSLGYVIKSLERDKLPEDVAVQVRAVIREHYPELLK